MRMTRIRIFAAASAFAGALLALAAHAAPAQPEVIKPVRDITAIHLPGGDIALLHGAIDMNNAHPVETASFFKPSAKGPAQQIPFEMNGDYEPMLSLRSGADCVVSSMRVLRYGDRLQVVYATRKGEWADKKPVTFFVFGLTKNDEGAPGMPGLYFSLRKKVDTRASYCDVNTALDKEAALYRTGAD